MYVKTPPLTEREVRIIRGMIDEHEYRQQRQRFLGEALHDVRVLLAVAGGVMLIALQITELVLIFGGRR